MITGGGWLLFFSGFVLSWLGSIPPGLISLSVAQTAALRGLRAALVLGAGAAVAEFFQAWIAAEAAGWFLQHPTVERGLRWAAVPVFLGMGAWLTFWPNAGSAGAAAPTASPVTEGKTIAHFFLKGLLISVFNLLAIPYWLAYCAGLRSTDWWREGWWPTLIFSAGVTTGTFLALALYAAAAQWAVQRSDAVARYANRTVGVIFLGLGLWMVSRLVG